VDATRLKVLVVDEAPDTFQFISEALSSEPLQVVWAPTIGSAIEHFERIHPRIVLADFAMPGMDGLELMDRFLAADPGTDFVLLADRNLDETALDAIRRGATECLYKPLQIDKLQLCVHLLVEQALERERAQRLEQQSVQAFQFQGMIGRGPLMLEVFRKIRRIAPHFRTVLVTGATGTGKELVARALHNLSPTPSAPFAVCSAASTNFSPPSSLA